MRTRSTFGCRLWRVAAFTALILSPLHAAGAALLVSVDAHGSYRIGRGGSSTPTLISAVAAQVDGRWISATDYPQCRTARSAGNGPLGPARVWQVRCFGLRGKP